MLECSSLAGGHLTMPSMLLGWAVYKGFNHRCSYSTVYVIINKKLLGQLEITCFGAKNKEDCSSLFLSGFFLTSVTLHLQTLSFGVPHVSDVGSGHVWPWQEECCYSCFIYRKVPSSTLVLGFRLFVECFLPVRSLITIEDVTVYNLGHERITAYWRHRRF